MSHYFCACRHSALHWNYIIYGNILNYTCELFKISLLSIVIEVSVFEMQVNTASRIHGHWENVGTNILYHIYH